MHLLLKIIIRMLWMTERLELQIAVAVEEEVGYIARKTAEHLQ